MMLEKSLFGSSGNHSNFFLLVGSLVFDLVRYLLLLSFFISFIIMFLIYFDFHCL